MFTSISSVHCLRSTMKLIWSCMTLCVIISSIVCIDVKDNKEDINTTTLYPITNNITQHGSTPKSENNKNEVTIWKVDATYAQSNLSKDNDSDSSKSKELVTISEAKNENQFKPSLHLGSFEDSDEIVATRGTALFTPGIKKKPTSFVSSPKDETTPALNPPKLKFKETKFPYKFERAIITKTKNNWRPTNSIEPKPTMQVPVKLPAGGLYQIKDPFREKPSHDDDDDFGGLEFSGDFKENSIKKRVNPWKNLLRLVTAFIPVGLIISALTPSVVTIHPNANEQQQYPFRFNRRLDIDLEEVPPITEPCRRRLLCELHSDKFYQTTPSRHQKQCYRIRCEDTEALSKALYWLLTYHKPREHHKNVGYNN